VRAVVHHRYGSPDVLEIVDVDKPAPGDDEVLVRVRATSVNATEWYSLVSVPPMRVQTGIRGPKDPRLGADFAGVVEAVGSARTDFAPGDEVYGARTGAFAEYVCVKNAIAPKPENLTFEQAAAVPIAAITALQAVRDIGSMQPGESVLVNGASGGVGTFAVQIAKALGAGHVTAVCSTRNVEQARSLGADRVVDYTKDDFARSEAGRHDLVLDVAGGRSYGAIRRVLKPGGRFVMVGAPRGGRVLGPLAHLAKVKIASLGRSPKAAFFIAKLTKEDLLVLNEMFATGTLTPVVERTFPLSEIADAMRHLGEGHARGKIVVTV
jgi:NADPH:quinone reductase-like Zn-dependent oxidoreductase